MNSDQLYARHLDRKARDVDPPDSPEPAALAVRGDPSRNLPPAPTPNKPSGRSVTWVRVSELATVVGSPAVRRGIDLQAELTRRARRAPGVAVSKTRAVVARRSTAEPVPGSRNGVTDRGWSL